MSTFFQKIRLLTLGFSLAFLFLPAVAYAQGFDPLGQSCTGEAAKSPACKQKIEQLTKKTNPVVTTIKSATNIIAIVASVAAVITIVFSGYKFVTAGGSIGGQRAGDNPTRAREARSTLAGAVIGLIIIALAWSITTIVLNRLL